MNLILPSDTRRPFARGEYLMNPGGSWSNEITTVITDKRINHGRPTVVPTLWIDNGKPIRLSEDQAADYAAVSGLVFPSFENEKQANDFTVKRESAWQNIKPEDAGKVPQLWYSVQQ